MGMAPLARGAGLVFGRMEAGFVVAWSEAGLVFRYTEWLILSPTTKIWPSG